MNPDQPDLTKSSVPESQEADKSKFTCSVRLDGDIQIFSFGGQILSEQDVDEFWQFIQQHVQENFSGVILNFDAVTFCSSAVLAKLMRLSKQMKAKETALRLCGMAPSIYEIFQITNMHRSLTIDGNEEEALRSLRKKKWFFS